MLEKLRSKWMVPVWTIIRIYVGLQWVEAGIEKLTGGFDAAKFLQGAIGKAGGDHPVVQGWYAAFLKGFALPNVELFNFIVPWGELFAGLGLILGTFTTIALYAAAFMNLNFMLAGSTSTNPLLYTLAVLLLVAGTAAYAWGADRFLIPWMKSYFANIFNRERHTEH